MEKTECVNIFKYLTLSVKIPSRFIARYHTQPVPTVTPGKFGCILEQRHLHGSMPLLKRKKHVQQPRDCWAGWGAGSRIPKPTNFTWSDPPRGDHNLFGPQAATTSPHRRRTHSEVYQIPQTKGMLDCLDGLRSRIGVAGADRSQRTEFV